MGRHQQLIKNRRTQTNKVAANWRGKEGGGERGRYCTKVECFLVLLLHKRELFPPAEQYIRADIAHDMVGAVKRTLSERSLDGQFVLLHTVIFYRSRAMVCVFTGMDGSSYRGLFLVFYKISEDYQPEMSTCVMTEVCL